MIAKGGRGFVGVTAILAVIALPFYLYISVAFTCLTAFLIFVFRDPDRTVGQGIVAVADGTVRSVDHANGLVSTYLALRNVHVTRAPIEGVVQKQIRTRGKHAPAFSKNTEHNERLEIILDTRIGQVLIIEMTGAIARRIVPYSSDGQSMSKGQRLSLVRFGSRVDVYLPPTTVSIKVKKGDRLKAGVTCIGEVGNGRVE